MIKFQCLVLHCVSLCRYICNSKVDNFFIVCVSFYVILILSNGFDVDSFPQSYLPSWIAFCEFNSSFIELQNNYNKMVVDCHFKEKKLAFLSGFKPGKRAKQIHKIKYNTIIYHIISMALAR